MTERQNITIGHRRKDRTSNVQCRIQLQNFYVILWGSLQSWIIKLHQYIFVTETFRALSKIKLSLIMLILTPKLRKQRIHTQKLIKKCSDTGVKKQKHQVNISAKIS